MTDNASHGMTAERLEKLRVMYRGSCAAQKYFRLENPAEFGEVLAHIDAQAAEIERLKAKLNEWKDDVHNSPLKQLTLRAMKAEAEIERLTQDSGALLEENNRLRAALAQGIERVKDAEAKLKELQK